MIHYWECDRCTHTWTSSCMGAMMTKPEDRKQNYRQLVSGLCWDCFELLETGEIAGLELFDLVFYLTDKSEKYGGKRNGDFVPIAKYSGMCHPYIADTYNSEGNIAIEGNFVSGTTDEEKQLCEIVRDVKAVYEGVIEDQRTAKRIELDKFQKTVGFRFFGPRQRPENFVGDPPGKVRFTTLFGLDLVSGDVIAPCIIAEDGTGEKHE